MREGLDTPKFGYLPFDHFVLADWDAASPLSQTEQKRVLVEKWIALGKYGRNDYALAAFEDPIPDHLPPEVPQDLLSEDDRAISNMLSSTLWIRTWFGGADQASQDAADSAYGRLRREVLHQGRENYHVSCICEEFVFEDRRELSCDAEGPDVVGGIAAGRPGSVPGYLIAAMMHCPELFEGTSDDDWRHFSGDQRAEELQGSDRSQAALVIVADRKACEEGWVLLLAVNHRGQILPFRVREKARETAQHAVNWLEGQPLSEIAFEEDENAEFYMGEGYGWD